MLIYLIGKVNGLQLLHVTGTQLTCVFLHFIKVSSGPALQAWVPDVFVIVAALHLSALL